MIDRKAKLYKIICPSCNDERFVAYAQNWNIKVGNSTGNCKGCDAKTNMRGNVFAKGFTPWNKGMKGFMKGHPAYSDGKHFLGKKHKPESLEKMKIAALNRKVHPNLGRHWKVKDTSKMGTNKGELHWKWLIDRNQLKTYKDSEAKRSPAYKNWRKQVADRDSWKCKIANKDCSGRLEVHHILGWTAYPELRYDINNGIALCHFHHPKKRSDEAKLSPYFQQLVSENKITCQ